MTKTQADYFHSCQTNEWHHKYDMLTTNRKVYSKYEQLWSPYSSAKLFPLHRYAFICSLIASPESYNNEYINIYTFSNQALYIWSLLDIKLMY